jgi:hypothetical protein
MSNGQQGPRGRGTKPFPNLKDAVEDAWNDAKRRDPSSSGTFKVDIYIDASNPIHNYIVVISPSPIPVPSP